MSSIWSCVWRLDLETSLEKERGPVTMRSAEAHDSAGPTTTDWCEPQNRSLVLFILLHRRDTKSEKDISERELTSKRVERSDKIEGGASNDTDANNVQWCMNVVMLHNVYIYRATVSIRSATDEPERSDQGSLVASKWFSRSPIGRRHGSSVVTRRGFCSVIYRPEPKNFCSREPPQC